MMGGARLAARTRASAAGAGGQKGARRLILEGHKCAAHLRARRGLWGRGAVMDDCAWAWTTMTVGRLEGEGAGLLTADEEWCRALRTVSRA